MPHPCQQPPYPWAEHAARLGYDEPGHFEDRTHYLWDLETQHQPLFLEGFWAGCYPTTKAQEN